MNKIQVKGHIEMPEFKSEVVIDKNAFTEKGLNNFFNYADVLSFSRFNADDLLFEGIDNLDSEYISDDELFDMFGDADCVENMDSTQMRELYFFILGSSEFEKEQMMEHMGKIEFNLDTSEDCISYDYFASIDIDITPIYDRYINLMTRDLSITKEDTDIER